MAALAPLPLAALALLTLLLALALVWLAMAYARRRALLDLPGQRRSHRVPTPRGGGIGIVLAGGSASLVLAGGFDDARVVPAFAALVLVAGVGWIDDHRSLPAALRFLVHCSAALLLVGAWRGGLAAPGLPAALLLPTAFLGIVWSINLHNFMDGIDGLLASQALFVLATFAALAFARDAPFVAQLFLSWFAATLGFLPFNAPRARIFMGDVGSSVLGLVIAAGVLALAVLPRAATLAALAAASTFVVDATCTLLSRIRAGRRWYSAHREHLYQWLVRTGCSHARVVALYMGWNVLIVLPAVVLIHQLEMDHADVAMLALCMLYGLGILAWVLGKRRCLAVARAGRKPCCAA